MQKQANQFINRIALKQRLMNNDKLVSLPYVEINFKIPLVKDRDTLWRSHSTLNCLLLTFSAPKGSWSPEMQSQIMAHVKVSGFERDILFSPGEIKDVVSKGGKKILCAAVYGKSSCIFRHMLYHSLHCPGPSSSFLRAHYVCLEQPQSLLYYFSLFVASWLKAKGGFIRNYPSSFSTENWCFNFN